jgi:hypothetical protein
MCGGEDEAKKHYRRLSESKSGILRDALRLSGIPTNNSTGIPCEQSAAFISWIN